MEYPIVIEQDPDEKPLPKKSVTLDTSEMLTPSELEELRRVSRENVALLQKEFPGVKVHR